MPHLIGIAGGSGAGKTTLARALAGTLGDAVVLPMDAYYRDLAHLTPDARARWNFDAPEAFEWTRFIGDLRALHRGEPIRRPVYDFSAHTRRPDAERVIPRPYVIVEGLLVLHHQDIRVLLDTAVFVEIDDRTALERRVVRDGRQRGRRPDEVRAQFGRDVRPMFERHVRPTARWATLTVSGADRLETNVRRVAAAIEPRPG